jgi:hypothetical protein
LRHTAGSFWLADNVPLDVVSKWLGPRAVDYTRKVYIHDLDHDERGLRGLYQLSERLVGRMKVLGIELRATDLPKRLPPPAGQSNERARGAARLCPTI